MIQITFGKFTIDKQHVGKSEFMIGTLEVTISNGAESKLTTTVAKLPIGGSWQNDHLEFSRPSSEPFDYNAFCSFANRYCKAQIASVFESMNGISLIGCVFEHNGPIGIEGPFTISNSNSIGGW